MIPITVLKDGMDAPTEQPQTSVDISFVIPVMDEELNVAELHRQLIEVLEGIPHRAEILFIDDGSQDGTLGVLEQLYDADPRVRVLGLRRNFGKTAALLAGFREARGRIIITMDGDLQDDPAEVPKFLDA